MDVDETIDGYQPVQKEYRLIFASEADGEMLLSHLMGLAICLGEKFQCSSSQRKRKVIFSMNNMDSNIYLFADNLK